MEYFAPRRKGSFIYGGIYGFYLLLMEVGGWVYNRICITLCGRVVVLDLFFKLGYSWRNDSFGAWYFNIRSRYQLDIADE